jgi:D-glycero-alpha-D-manno-heptose-7-phosphate kinase
MTSHAPTVMAATATAPVRIADVGGWTDTWFGSPGHVCHLAVGPGVTVRAARTNVDDATRPVHVRAPDLGADYRVAPSPTYGWATPTPLRHPLIEHAVGIVLADASLPRGDGIAMTITSAVPPGASLGTSAAVLVATLAALHTLVGDEPPGASALAEQAHAVETVRAGRQAGVQDQWAAAFGGAGLLRVDPYPQSARRALELSDATQAALDVGLVTVVFAPHDSSAVHAEVIDALGHLGGAADRIRAALHRLDELARQAADALERGDVEGWAHLLTEATEAQRALHPRLVGPAHTAAIEVARRAGASGWKVNGAGGDGGSLTVACPDADRAAAVRAALRAQDPSWQVLDLRVAPGVAVQRDTER